MFTNRLLIVFVLILSGCTGAPVSQGNNPTIPPPTSTAVVQVNAAPAISIQPSEVLIDEPVSIRLSGFEPNQEVTIRATTVGTAFPDLIDTGIVRESEATFQTDSNGEVDLEKQAPLSGSYTDADGMGLFWSLTENSA